MRFYLFFVDFLRDFEGIFHENNFAPLSDKWGKFFKNQSLVYIWGIVAGLKVCRARLLSIHYKPLNQEVTKGVYNVSFFCPNTLGIILSIPQQTTNSLIARHLSGSSNCER